LLIGLDFTKKTNLQLFLNKLLVFEDDIYKLLTRATFFTPSTF